MTVGDAELRGRARIRWEIRRGTRAELSFLAEGVGEDLQVEGPLVSRWRREGADVIVELGGETKGLVDLDLRWSVAAPPGAEASVPLPTLAPHEVFRSDAAVQIARDGEIDVRPELSGWSPIASGHPRGILACHGGTRAQDHAYRPQYAHQLYFT